MTEAEQALCAQGCDPFEQGLLVVARHLAQGFTAADPRSHTPQLLRAQRRACERWGETIGLAACHYLMAVLDPLICARDTAPVFHDPLCLEARNTLSDDERLLITLLHQMRRDQTPRARETLFLLSGGVMDAHLIRAALSFAARFPCGAAKPHLRHRPPSFRVVPPSAVRSKAEGAYS